MHLSIWLRLSIYFGYVYNLNQLSGRTNSLQRPGQGNADDGLDRSGKDEERGVSDDETALQRQPSHPHSLNLRSKKKNKNVGGKIDDEGDGRGEDDENDDDDRSKKKKARKAKGGTKAKVGSFLYLNYSTCRSLPTPFLMTMHAPIYSKRFICTDQDNSLRGRARSTGKGYSWT